MNKSLKGKGARRRRRKSARRRRTASARRRRTYKAPKKAANVGAPYTWIKGTRGWATQIICHVDKPEVMAQMPQDAAVDNIIRGFWRLVASSTHGASIKIETGFSSRYKESTTKESASQFSATASASAAVTVAAENKATGSSASATATVGGSVTSGGSSSIASTAASTMGQSKTEMITVQCPDEQTDTRKGSWTTGNTSHSSLSLEYVYQWVVGNAEYEAKTQ